MTDFATTWASLTPLGRDPTTGGYLRYAWSPADLACRRWFTEQAESRGLLVQTDNNGNMWAYLGDPGGSDLVVTGSHFDSVPQGGAFDGPLGIVSAFLALDLLRQQGFRAIRPLAIVAFTEEEGSRFGVACLGSRLMTGAIDPHRAAALTDRDGISLRTAMRSAGHPADSLGPSPERLRRIGVFVELHIEQGRALTAPVGVGSAIWPHGRWRLEFEGEGNHAGTTPMVDRRDPMLTFAHTVLVTDAAARGSTGHATIGRVAVHPNATNAIPSKVSGWLDARAPSSAELDGLVETIVAKAGECAQHDQTTLTVTKESETPVTDFDAGLRDELARLLGGAPIVPTAAGHDSGVLAGHVPTAMLFVRNLTGLSHAPAENASLDDCVAGVEALATVLRELSCRP